GEQQRREQQSPEQPSPRRRTGTAGETGGDRGTGRSRGRSRRRSGRRGHGPHPPAGRLAVPAAGTRGGGAGGGEEPWAAAERARPTVVMHTAREDAAASDSLTPASGPSGCLRVPTRARRSTVVDRP